MRRCRRGVVAVAVAGMFACNPSADDATAGSGSEVGGFAFDRYHRVEEFEQHLEAMAERHSGLATLATIGTSRAGRRILSLEINNPTTGPPESKPGFYVDGNIHGGEVLGGEAALYFIEYLLTGYGRDSAITSLVDTRTFYVVPLVNPDGRAISVDTPENHRWNIRPVDEDEDGIADEDPPEDLDGDGRILQMRVPDPDGEWVVASTDLRRMERKGRNGDGGRRRGASYHLYREGVDNDGDGRFNEDGVGGVDLNRNFPSNWSPAQYASGPYPLSEPETHALIDYITSHPNIAAIHTFHTSGGLLLRFPTLADQDWDFPGPDLEDYRSIADAGVELTGYDNYAYAKQPIVDLMSPGHGVFNDWASKVFGVLAMTTEMWKHPMGGDRGDLFDWNDEVLGGKGFIGWYRFEHPQLGPVELGGWDRWSIASPPEPLIAEELDRNVRWVLTFAERLPRVRILEATVSSGTPPSLLEVKAVVANVGWMPTATAYAETVLRTAKPVLVHLSLSNAQLAEGMADIDLGVLPGARGAGPVFRHVSWAVRIVEPSQPASVEITVSSEKAGGESRVVRLAG